MCTFTRLSRLFDSAEEIPFNNSSRFILMSDCHRGDGSRADDFARNKEIYMAALNYYYKNGFTYIEVGDGDELWENRGFSSIKESHCDTFELIKKFHQKNRLHMIWGNHDILKRNSRYFSSSPYRYCKYCRKACKPLFDNISVHEGLILKHQNTGNKIFVVHGHQGDLINDRLWPLGLLLVRYFVRSLELIGIKNPVSPAKNHIRKDIIEKRIINWVKTKNQMVIAGHTHRPMFPRVGEPPYFNDGSCVHFRSITGIEIQNGKISLVRWSVKVRDDYVLYIAREVLEGPERLDLFYDYSTAQQIGG